MKNICYLMASLFVLCLVQSASAQAYIGITAGLNYSDLRLVDNTLKPGDELNAQIRYGIGGVIGYRLNEYVSLHFEPMFAKSAIEMYDAEDNITGQFTNNSLELPVF